LSRTDPVWAVLALLETPRDRTHAAPINHLQQANTSLLALISSTDWLLLFSGVASYAMGHWGTGALAPSTSNNFHF